MDQVVYHLHRSKILTWVFLVSSWLVAQNNIESVILNSGCSRYHCSPFLIDHKNGCDSYKILVKII